MTDPAAPQGRPSPGAPVGPTPPAAKKPGGRGALIIVGLLVVFLAVVLFVVRNNVAAGDLKVGDCFDIPNGTTVRTCLLYTSPSPRDGLLSRMPSSA